MRAASPADDGLGWWLNLVCTVAARFGERPQVVSDEWPLAQCWAYSAWIAQNDPWCPLDMATDGYIAQARLKS